MPRVLFQTALVISCALFVPLAAVSCAFAQDAGPPVAATQTPAAAPRDTDPAVQRTSADTPVAATEPDDSDMVTVFPHSETSRYWISGQANIILQWHGSFPAAYSGKNSFRPVPENATSKVYTFYRSVPGYGKCRRSRPQQRLGSGRIHESGCGPQPQSGRRSLRGPDHDPSDHSSER